MLFVQSSVNPFSEALELSSGGHLTWTTVPIATQSSIFNLQSTMPSHSTVAEPHSAGSSRLSFGTSLTTLAVKLLFAQ